MAPRTIILLLAAQLFSGCGSTPEETRRSLQGTWIAGAYLDTLSASGSPLRASRALNGITDLHYDPTKDSAVIGLTGGGMLRGSGLTLLDDGSIRFSGGEIPMIIDGPRGADRLRIGDVELRRVSRVAEMTVSEYLVRRYFAGTYSILEPPGNDSTVTISQGGAVNGLGDIITLAPVADYTRPFPPADALMLETLFQPDTLFYSWRAAGDTLYARWIVDPGHPRRNPPAIPGSAFTLLRQRP